MDSQKKTDAYELMDSQKTDAYELMNSQKTDVYKLMDSQKTDAYKLTDSQKKTDAYELMDSQKTDAYELMDSQKIDEYEMTDAQKIDEYEMMGAQKIDEYEPTDSQKIDEYQMTGAQKKKIDAYKLMNSQKTREYNLVGTQKTDGYELMYSQKNRDYNLNSAQKTDEYEINGALNPCVQTRKVKNPCVQNSSCVEVRKNDGVEINHNCQRQRACQDADVKPVVRDPMDDDRILVESGAEMTLFHMSLPSLKNRNTISLTSHFNHGAHHASKAKQKAEPHKRTERIIEDSELPVIQCDYLMLKDVAGTGGLKVFSMYVRTFGYGHSR